MCNITSTGQKRFGTFGRERERRKGGGKVCAGSGMSAVSLSGGNYGNSTRRLSALVSFQVMV